MTRLWVSCQPAPTASLVEAPHQASSSPTPPRTGAGPSRVEPTTAPEPPGRQGKRPHPTAAPAQAPERAAAASGGSPPTAPWARLHVPGFQPALVSLPASTHPGAPVIVVAHGAGGTPDWHCELWRELTQAGSYLLCLAGTRMIANPARPSGYYFKDHHALEAEAWAALDALEQQFPDADTETPSYAGYSQGATMGALMLAGHGDRFQRVALIEGGFDQWNLAIAAQFAAAGARRVLFVCGRSSCERGALRSAAWLEQSGVATRVEHAVGAGHTPADEVAERLARSLPWLLEGTSASR